MHVIVVKDEKNLAEVRNGLIRSGVRGARARAVDDALRAANPHLDPDRLRAGSLVVVPDHPDLAEVSGGPAAGGMPPGDISAALPQVRDAVARGAQEAAKRARELRKALGSREVKAAAADDEQVRDEVARLSEAVTAEQRRAEEWARAMAAKTERWQQALAALGTSR